MTNFLGLWERDSCAAINASPAADEAATPCDLRVPGER